jgi:hypothetical protein
MTMIGGRLGNLSAAFARRRQELASAIAAGRDRMAFMHATTPRPL